MLTYCPIHCRALLPAERALLPAERGSPQWHALSPWKVRLAWRWARDGQCADQLAITVAPCDQCEPLPTPHRERS